MRGMGVGNGDLNPNHRLQSGLSPWRSKLASSRSDLAFIKCLYRSLYPVVVLGLKQCSLLLQLHLIREYTKQGASGLFALALYSVFHARIRFSCCRNFEAETLLSIRNVDAIWFNIYIIWRQTPSKWNICKIKKLSWFKGTIYSGVDWLSLCEMRWWRNEIEMITRCRLIWQRMEVNIGELELPKASQIRDEALSLVFQSSFSNQFVS